jgi:hypothetical protein
LRTVQPTAPRLVSEFRAAKAGTWGDSATSPRSKLAEVQADHSPLATLEQMAEVLAGGAQAIVSPFHGGTNFGFLAGRRAGFSAAGNFLTTGVADDAPLGEAGERGEKYALLKRLAMFANHFSGVFTELDPEYQPIALDPQEALEGLPATGRSSVSSSGPRVASVVSQRGTQGRAIFVFARPGDQPVNLVLDYCNICPWAVVDRSIVVLHGPAKAAVFLSIDGTPLETTVPADNNKPLVLDHHGLTVVILNRAQIDATYHDAQSVYVGIGGFDARNQPIPLSEWPKPWIISAGARLEPLAMAAPRGRGGSPSRRSEAVALGAWQALPATAHVTGASPRFASLEGPATLSDCGAPIGYGWYRMKFSASGRETIMLPHAGDRMHLFLNGALERIVGVGPGAKAGPFEVKFERGEQTLVVQADNLGRFSEGNDLGQRKGLFGHIYAVKPIRGRPKIASAKAVMPFSLRGFIEGRSSGQPSDERQAIWMFDHPRRTPIIIDVTGARTSGTFVLNDKPLAYYAGETGACADCIVVDPDSAKSFKRGRNVLRFAPDLGAGSAEDVADRTALYEATASLTEKAEWSFAKWEPPSGGSGKAGAAGGGHPAKPPRGQPCWWRANFEVDAALAASDRPLWLDVADLSKGQAFVNGQNLGRYFSATAEGRAVGPQTRMYVPAAWLKPGAGNELLLFDEHGFEASRVRLLRD